MLADEPANASPPPVEWRKGQPKSPWRVRKEAEAAAVADVERRILEAVQEGRAREVLHASEIALARVCFSVFCRLAWPVLEPTTHLDWGRHHELICTVLQALFEDWLRSKQDRSHFPLVRNTVFNCPPGSLKSKLIAVLFPAWVWIRAPGTKFICISVNELAALRDARDTRTLMASEWYRLNFQIDWTLRSDQDAISDYGNTAGGARLSRPSGSTIIGLRGDCVGSGVPVATEKGDIPIESLHEMAERGEVLPRVWSMNHVTGVLELRAIQATRRLRDSEVIDVRTEAGHWLRCTADHRIYTDTAYTPAAYLAGRKVSVLRWPELPRTLGNTAQVCELRDGDANLRVLPENVPALGGRVRQARSSRPNRGPVLQQVVQDARDSGPGNDTVVPTLRQTLPHQGQGASVLLEELLSCGRCGAPADVATSHVPGVPGAVQGVIVEDGLLLQGLRESSPFGSHDRSGKLELLGARRQQTLRRRPLASPCSADSRAGRESLSRLRGWAGRTRTPGAPHRREPKEQHTREPDHSLFDLSHNTPQVERVTVLSIDPALEGGRRAKVDVYDLQVEGNHNFFAGGILTHNCLLADDLSDPDHSHEAAERARINGAWDSNQYKRVNDELRSLRICIQQRVHTDDHTGHVIRKQGLWSPENRDGWLHVVLPAEFEIRRPKFELPVGLRKYVRHLPGAELRDWRTVEGEILHPARMTPESLAAEKKRCAGTSNYACQMQQRPVDAAGGKIKREWFGFFRLAGGVRDDIDQHDLGRVRPQGCEKAQTVIVEAAHYRPGFWDFDLVVLSVDPALKKTERGSLWGMIAIGIKGGRRYVLDDRSQRGEPDDAIRVLQEMVIQWKPDKILIENKAGGEGLRRNLEIEMGNGDMPMVELVMVDPGTQDKDARLNSALPTIANGMLLLREGASWLEDFVDELSGYPLAQTDDRTDAVTQAINEISVEDMAYPSASAWGAASGMGAMARVRG